MTHARKNSPYTLVFRPVRRLLVAAVVSGVSCASLAQADVQAVAQSTEPATEAANNSTLDGPLFYQLLLGELKLQDGDPGSSFSLILDGARRHHSEQLYRRAVEIALQARSGESALQAAQQWRDDLKDSVEAHRFVLQILLALNRIEQTAPSLKAILRLTPQEELVDTINSIPQVFNRTRSQKEAAKAVRQALKPYLEQKAYTAAAWTSLGRMALAAEDKDQALEAARKGHASDPASPFPALLALELMEAKIPDAEAIVLRQLQERNKAEEPVVPMAYARVLMDINREKEAIPLLRALTTEQPERPDPWLLLGTLEQQAGHPDQAREAVQTFIKLSEKVKTSRARQGLTQAYLLMAQMDEEAGKLDDAQAWLAKVDNADDILAAQMRRASLLARQGRMTEARALLRSQPANGELGERTKLIAEAQLLRDFGQWKLAYEVYGEAVQQFPDDENLRYEHAIAAEKAGLTKEMEAHFRELIRLKPNFHHAYNALGYSLADRNERLDEARDLIQKALELAPDDAYIQDSMGWVLFRMGKTEESLRILKAAYAQRQDVEIAAHLGEVLWAAGQKEEARKVWRQALLKAGGNETLQSTLRRLNVTP
ncbi:tetratricopeptide repeat protein [Hydrogenophaga sp. 5NK40-0174]|uniref:tetratricopeptide repeat protein n=1 Tax=Hydrogenophaga sp. 5NK40-0174 TaxID=3127649 RepID=UPI00310424BC